MSSIPPDIASSAAQAGFAAPEASRTKDADGVAQARAAAQQARISDDAVDSVDTADGDTEIYADAEGTGSQGRSFSDEEPSTGGEENENRLSGDDDEHPTLDLQA